MSDFVFVGSRQQVIPPADIADDNAVVSAILVVMA